MMLLERSESEFTISQNDIRKWELITNAIKKNFILEPTIDDSFIASKSIEGVKTMPHLVILYLCFYFRVPIELMELHFDLTDKKMQEFISRLCIGIHKNDTNLLRKIQVCKSYVERKL